MPMKMLILKYCSVIAEMEEGCYSVMLIIAEAENCVQKWLGKFVDGIWARHKTNPINTVANLKIK